MPDSNLKLTSFLVIQITRLYSTFKHTRYVYPDALEHEIFECELRSSISMWAIFISRGGEGCIVQKHFWSQVGRGPAICFIKLVVTRSRHATGHRPGTAGLGVRISIKLESSPFRMNLLVLSAQGKWLCQCLERKSKKLISYPSIISYIMNSDYYTCAISIL